MQTENVVTFDTVHFTDHKGRTHDGVRAQIMETDLMQNDMILRVMDLLNGCSLLHPHDALIVDFHRVHRISVSFWTQFLQLRRWVRARGGVLRVYRLDKSSKDLLATLLARANTQGQETMLSVGA